MSIEKINTSPETTRVTEEQKEELQHALGQVGLVDATLFDYPMPDHPDDERWIVRGED